MAQNQLQTYVSEKMPAAWELKSKSLNIDMNTYMKKAILSIYDNKSLSPVTKTDAGIAKIMMCIANAAMMGLQFGGQFPQVYIVGFNGSKGPEVTLIPTAEGYRHMATQGETPILKEFTIRAVYEGEKFDLNYVTGVVEHTFDGKKDRGQLIGVYGIIVENGDVKRAEYMPRKDIEAIRDTHSKYWITQKKGPWKDDFDQMCIKTAAKRFLKPYAAMKEGREIAAAMEEEQHADIETRAEIILDNADIEVDMTAEETPEEKPAETKKDDKKKNDKELF